MMGTAEEIEERAAYYDAWAADIRRLNGTSVDADHAAKTAEVLRALVRERDAARTALEPFCSFGINLDSRGVRGSWISVDIDKGNEVELQPYRGRGEPVVYDDDKCIITAVEEMVGGNCAAALTFGDFRRAVQTHCPDRASSAAQTNSPPEAPKEQD